MYTRYYIVKWISFNSDFTLVIKLAIAIQKYSSLIWELNRYLMTHCYFLFRWAVSIRGWQEKWMCLFSTHPMWSHPRMRYA